MPITKLNLVEVCILLLFAASLYILYLLFIEANNPGYRIENEFKQSMLRGALYLAFSEQGKLIRTKDFNFIGPRGITANSILMDSELELLPKQLCFALGEAKILPFSGGAEGGDESAIRCPLGISGPFHFSVLCYKANALFEKIRENEAKDFKVNYFSNCSCLKETGRVCCVVALGKDKG